MSAEKIIQQIKKDSQSEIKKIQNETDSQVKNIIQTAKDEAKTKAEKILESGKKQSETHKKIMISKENQIVKRDIMKAREKIIAECFVKAHHELSILPNNKYNSIVTKLFQDGTKKLGSQCTAIISRDADKEIAKKLGIIVTGKVEASGGIILQSNDGNVTLDNTFDGILKREKDIIRNKVGKLLFS